ncbi:MAG: hypothetical protein EXQ58_00430 [Acidobacteria bacterium]|nr:hypothetical protein [Acidobacteriota bacterium]
MNVVNLWTWVGKELWSLEANFKKAEELAGGKPIVMGLYLWDFGANRSLSLDLMEHQCTVSLNLLKQRRLSGIVFLSSAVCGLGLESVEWVRSWIQKVGAQTLG